MGLFRPAILILPGLEEAGSRERLRLSLLHELAHAERADHRFGPAATLARAVWFFLPPVWWVRDQMNLDQEFLADRRAVAHFGTSGGYASSLVELASGHSLVEDEETVPNEVARSEATQSGVASALVQRVLMLVKCPFAIEGEAPHWLRRSTVATLAFATLAASGLTLRGMAGWSSEPVPATPPAELVRSFRLPQLVIRQRDPDDPPFDLLFRLPDQFHMTFEVLAEADDLPAVEILGHRLGPIADADLDREGFRLWHRVQVRRSEGREFVEVDGRPLPTPLKPLKLSPWLTIRPLPAQTTRIRDLELLW